jgi:hypothetical protein
MFLLLLVAIALLIILPLTLTFSLYSLRQLGGDDPPGLA